MRKEAWERKASELTDNPVSKALALLGGQIKASKLLGVNQGYIGSWALKTIPIDRALQLAKAVNYAVTYQEMRPDLDWGPPVTVYIAAPTEEEIARSTGT